VDAHAVAPGFRIIERGGLVGTVAAVSEQVSTYGFAAFINALVVISINLGIMNLLPIPGLDGARFLFLLVEAIRRKPLPQKKEAIVNLIGMAWTAPRQGCVRPASDFRREPFSFRTYHSPQCPIRVQTSLNTSRIISPKSSDLTLGGHNPVWVQSMTNTDTRDAQATLAQIRALAKAGCDIVRVTIRVQTSLNTSRIISPKSSAMPIRLTMASFFCGSGLRRMASTSRNRDMYETRMVRVGNLTLGGHNPVWVQSMTNTDTRDAQATLVSVPSGSKRP